MSQAFRNFTPNGPHGSRSEIQISNDMNLRKLFCVVLGLGAAGFLYAQKPAMGHDVYDGWQSVASPTLTPDGSVLTYAIAEQEGDREAVIRRVFDGKEVRIPRGTGVQTDGVWAWVQIKPAFKVTRQARIDKKKADEMPKDSLMLVNIKTLETKVFPNIKAFKVGTDAMNFAAYTFDKGLVVVNPATGAVDTLKNVDQYIFTRDGQKMALTFKQDKKDSLSRNEIALYDPATGAKTVLDQDKPYYGGLVFDNSGNKLAFLSSTDDVKDGNKHCAIMLSENGKAPQTIVSQNYRGKNDWIVNENAAPYFSTSGNRLFAGIAPFTGPKDTTIIDFETARLDIWNWDALLTPPMQKVQASRITRRTYPVVIDLSSASPVLLSEGDFESLTYILGGDNDMALVVDDTPYRLSSYWDSNNFVDVRLVSLKDGSRRTVAEKLPASVRISTGGKYLIWYNYDDSQWYTYNIATGEEVCLTADLRVNFYDELDDHPAPAGPYERSPLWTAGDEYVLISDRYDIWKFKADGSKVECLTKGAGRENKIQFRRASYIDYGISANDRRLGITVLPSETSQIWLTTFDEVSKKNGLAVMTGLKPQVPEWYVRPTTLGTVVIARNAPVMAFTEGDYRHPYNLRLAYDANKKGIVTGSKFSIKPSLEKRIDAAYTLTDINKQQQNYRWGDARLVHWTAYDGTPLDGILVVPDDVKPGEKLPLMIYFYERNSETLYNYRAPAPSRSTVNIPMYVSNGYAVFIPDIVYVDGHPGESAYNCICSGAQAMCDQFDFLDRKNMAIQGQSWGGYQTAYLITRTDMFIAAGAGAPVGNMTSAYGGIRWESGLVRAMQYEHGQSRIGKSIWDEGGLELYIENSPIFHVNKVKTPVLIMANDADGAVPWYQGIEFFSDLRRFGKQAWLLQYNDEAHNLSERRNSKDLSVRLQQFFDHYMKGAPMPVWMKYGVPTHRKGQDFGFEYAE